MSDTDRIADLARLAEAATHGPWRADRWEDFTGREVTYSVSGDTEVSPTIHEHEDAEFIAAANPATILRLIADNERLTHLLGSHADGHRCTCTMTDPGSPFTGPPEWEQDPWCPTHPDVDQIRAEFDALAARLAAVEAELQQQRHRTAEFQTIAAGFANRAVAAEDRLAAVEVLSWELSPADGPRLRAALAAPTDTTKEN